MKTKNERILLTLDAGEVQRYHAFKAAPNQSVAEHSWGVAIILTQIAGPADNLFTLLLHALLHDTGELCTGDIPGHTKRDNPELKLLADKIADKFSEENLIQTDHMLSLQERWLLKLADMFEGLRYCKLYESQDGIATKRYAAYISYHIYEHLPPALTETQLKDIFDFYYALTGKRLRDDLRLPDGAHIEPSEPTSQYVNQG